MQKSATNAGRGSSRLRIRAFRLLSAMGGRAKSVVPMLERLESDERYSLQVVAAKAGLGRPGTPDSNTVTKSRVMSGQRRSVPPG